MGFKEEALLTMKNLENQAKNVPKAYICMGGQVGEPCSRQI